MPEDTKVIVLREHTKSSSSDSDSIFTSPVSPQTPPRRIPATNVDKRKKLAICRLENFEYLDIGEKTALQIVANESLNLDGKISPEPGTKEPEAEEKDDDEMRNRSNVQSDQHTSKNDNNSNEKIFNNVSRIKKVDLPDLPLTSRSAEIRSRKLNKFFAFLLLISYLYGLLSWDSCSSIMGIFLDFFLINLFSVFSMNL